MDEPETTGAQAASGGAELYRAAYRAIAQPQPEYHTALPLLYAALDAGSPQAAHTLGTWHVFGKEPHVAIDLRKARKLFRRAAAGDIPDALYDLAIMYEAGEGGKKRPRRAFAHYLRAALLGDVQSIYHVGRCYHFGIGVRRDRRLAEHVYRQAAALGYTHERYQSREQNGSSPPAREPGDEREQSRDERPAETSGKSGPAAHEPNHGRLCVPTVVLRINFARSGSSPDT